MSAERIGNIREVLDIFRECRRSRPNSRKEARQQARQAVLDVTRAFKGILTSEQVDTAMCRPRTTNAVSRAVRTRLPPL